MPFSCVPDIAPTRSARRFHAPLLRRLWRLLFWTAHVLRLGAEVLGDSVRGERSTARTGQRLRSTLERMGGVFVKLGQQLSTRLDLLDPEVCRELASLLDRTPPFPTEIAIAAIERVTQKKLEDTFQSFDPKPIGSASVSCVYHGILHNGAHVAVKVRRPGIAEDFSADVGAVDLIFVLLERLTLIRPGYTKAMRGEIAAMLMEELDFELEARYQELFRAKAKRDGQKLLTAPKLYAHLSGEDIIVSELVTGFWLIDVLAAKESNHQPALEALAAADVDLADVAARLIRARHWAAHENVFYHADPHPANIMVQPGGRLVFVDFGACGPTTNAMRRHYSEVFRRQSSRDGDGMIHVFLNMLAPLPHIDFDGFSRHAEREIWRWLYGFEAESAEWWEQTSAEMWLRLFKATREFNIPVNVETIRLMRSSLLYETVAARLHDRMSVRDEYFRYERDAAKRAIGRTLDSLTAMRPGTLLTRTFEQAEVATRLVNTATRLLEIRANVFRMVTKKSTTIGTLGLRVLALAGIVTGAGLAIQFFSGSAVPGSSNVSGLLERLAAEPLYWLLLVVVLLRNYRALILRLKDVDPGTRLPSSRRSGAGEPLRLWPDSTR